MSGSAWSPDRIGDLAGRRALVTGGTHGIGTWVVLGLARAGAEVVVAGRSAERLRALTRRVAAEVPGATVGTVPMDLASLSSVRDGADWAAREWDGFDLLVNNAGLMSAPRRRSVDGFELHMATNHLAHFVLTARLWPLIGPRGGRVVTVSSLYHAVASGIDLDVLTLEGSRRRYLRSRAYAESKLANLVFALELQRRIDGARSSARSMAAHPGYASTNLFRAGPSLGVRGPFSLVVAQVSRIVGQSAEAGAWPVLMAATVPDLAGGTFVGPLGQGGLRGAPGLVQPASQALDPALGAALWEASERASGQSFPVS